jgi:CBS domain-containing membrane protein
MTSLELRVSDLMEREVATLQQGDRLDLADDIMRLGRIRHLPVLEGERLVGILSNRDLLAASLSRALDFEPKHRRSFLRSVEVKEVMSLAVETVRPEATAREAGQRMIRHRIGCLPVVDAHGTFVGLLSETDILRAALGMKEEVVEGEAVETGGRYQQELDELRRVRDELRVQMHLGKAEAAELWERLEHRFAEAEGHVRALARRAEGPLHDVAEAARGLIDELGSGYRRLRKLLRED